MLKGRNLSSTHCDILSFICTFNCCLQASQYPHLDPAFPHATEGSGGYSEQPAGHGEGERRQPHSLPLSPADGLGVFCDFAILWMSHPLVNPPPRHERQLAPDIKKEKSPAAAPKKGAEPPAAPASLYPAGANWRLSAGVPAPLCAACGGLIIPPQRPGGWAQHPPAPHPSAPPAGAGRAAQRRLLFLLPPAAPQGKAGSGRAG